MSLDYFVYRWTGDSWLWRATFAVVSPTRRFIHDIPMKIAFRLPHQVALWAFIRVYAAAGDVHQDSDYRRVYDAWEARRKGKQ